MNERGIISLQMLLFIALLIFVPCCLDRLNKLTVCNRQQEQKIEALEEYVKKLEHKIVVQEQIFDAIRRGKEEW